MLSPSEVKKMLCTQSITCMSNSLIFKKLHHVESAEQETFNVKQEILKVHLLKLRKMYGALREAVVVVHQNRTQTRTAVPCLVLCSLSFNDGSMTAVSGVGKTTAFSLGWIYGKRVRE